MRTLESFRDERERAFRRMVHYQGQYPGCSTTLLTISPNCYTLYLPHSPLSYFPLSTPPVCTRPGNPFASFAATITFPGSFLAIRNRKLTKKTSGTTAATSSRRSGRISSSRPICLLNDRGFIEFPDPVAAPEYTGVNYKRRDPF